MSKPSTPAPPDFVGAAQQTGQSGITSAIIQRLMSQTGSNTPWGSLNWNQTGTQHVAGPGSQPQTFEEWNRANHGGDITSVTGPGGAGGAVPVDPGRQAEYDQYSRNFHPASGTGFDIPTFTSSVTLSPEQQAIFNQQQQNQQQSGQAAGRLIGGLDTSPINYSGMPSLPSGDQLNQTRQNVSDAIYGRQARYLDPQFTQAEDAERTRLANQGFQTGTEGFSRAMGDFNLSKQRAYADARDAAATQAGAEMSRDYGMGLSSRQQAVSEAMAQRQLPLNMIAALQGGQQVGMPSFPGAPSGQGVPGVDYMGAAQNAGNAAMQNYGINAGQYNSQMGGLYGLLGTGAMMYMMSDRRLKANIKRIAEHPLGIGVYSFTMGGQPFIGVMADEVERVMPDAIRTDAQGYKSVNYKMLANPSSDMVS
jgi:hypothetical protein